MKYHHAMPLACLALLAACASNPPASKEAKPGATVAAAMAEADAAMTTGQTDKAYAVLKAAAIAFPTDKTPWLRMAQMRFDSTDYGAAIVDALEALERDPDDTLANSIIAVSGLRVTSKALADLSQKNNLTGNVRTEAQELAKLLRSSLGEEALVPGARAGQRREAPPKRVGSATPPPARTAASSDPFGALK
jgi:tetratricopeptide (TPR) repeat protein